MRTVKNVAIARDDDDDSDYVIQVDDERIKPFVIKPWQVVEITDELVEECSWAAEVLMVDGLVPYLKAYDIFELDVSENGFTVNTSRLKGEATGSTETNAEPKP